MAIQWSFHIEEHTSNMMLLCMVLSLQCQALYYVVFKKVLLYTVYIKLLLIIGEDDGVIFTELIYLYYIYCMFFLFILWKLSPETKNVFVFVTSEWAFYLIYISRNVQCHTWFMVFTSVPYDVENHTPGGI